MLMWQNIRAKRESKKRHTIKGRGGESLCGPLNLLLPSFYLIDWQAFSSWRNFLISRGFHLSATSTSYSKVPFSSTEVYTLPLQPHSIFLFQPLSFHTSPGRLLACDTTCYLITSFLPLHLRPHPTAPFGFISIPRSERDSQRCSSFKFLTP